MPRFSPAMTQDKLLGLMVSHVSSNQGFVSSEEPKFTSREEQINAIRKALHCAENFSLFPKVIDDWSNIDFDRENVDVFDDPDLGLQTLDNGLSYFAVQAGGDWEHPIVAIIYHDEETFRGYIPIKGNVLDIASNAAYGSGDEDEEPDDAAFDHAVMKAEIRKQIRVR